MKLIDQLSFLYHCCPGKHIKYRLKTSMVKLLNYLCKHEGLTYSLVLPQEGSQRKSSEAIAEEIGAESPTRSRRQEAKGLAQKIHFIILNFIFPSKILFYYFFPGQQ